MKKIKRKPRTSQNPSNRPSSFFEEEFALSYRSVDAKTVAVESMKYENKQTEPFESIGIPYHRRRRRYDLAVGLATTEVLRAS